MYAEVYVMGVGNPWGEPLTYAVNDELRIGQVVTVPWGKKIAVGIISCLHENKPDFETKLVYSVLYNLPIPLHLLNAAKWMSQYYHEPIQHCFETVVLAKKSLKRRLKKNDKNNGKDKPQPSAIRLSQSQQEVVNEMLAKLDDYNSFLIHGITGSGKTEVYFEVMDRVIKLGGQVIYLVPEIGLTPQTINRVKTRFGERVRYATSELSEGERLQLIEDIDSDNVDIVVGSRSALFTPFKNLRLIVIDECHDSSYLQQSSPHYHAVNTAEFIASDLKIPLVLGSATPTVNQYFETNQKMRLLKLDLRANLAELPKVEVADMREELKKRNFTTISDLLEKRLQETLSRGEQAVLFINRRGFASAFLCRACGWRASCPRCSVALVYHQKFAGKSDVLACHQCDFIRTLPAACEACGSVLVKPIGSGTEKVVIDVQKLFPQVRVGRMDRDTTSKKGSHEEIFNSFVNGDYDVLVGTQMVTKGWDIPRVTCVGIVNADSMLHMPMYDAAERAFMLMMQVAGRAGRTKERPGSVVIQTYTPDHYAVIAAAEHNYQQFLAQELSYREMLRYPPFSILTELRYAHEKESQALKKAKEIYQTLSERIKVIHHSGTIEGQIEIMGPTEAPVFRVKEIYYYQILLKGNKEQTDQLLELVPRDWSIQIGI